MSWKDIAKRDIVGAKTELTSIKPDESVLEKWKEQDKNWTSYWIKAKKYSVKGKDRVDAISLRHSKTLPGPIKLKIAKITEDNPDISQEDVMKQLDDEDKLALMDIQTESFENVEILQAILQEGLAETNLINVDKGETLEGFIEEVVEYQEIIDEIAEVIKDFNLPLARKNRRKLKKQ